MPSVAWRVGAGIPLVLSTNITVTNALDGLHERLRKPHRLTSQLGFSAITEKAGGLQSQADEHAWESPPAL